MATRGVFQCKKLTLRYCEHGGSSRAVRDYLSSGQLLDWARQRPSVDIKVKVRNGKHPNLRAEYVTQAVSNKSANGSNPGSIASKPVIHQICLKSKGVTTDWDNGTRSNNKLGNPIIEEALTKLFNKSGRKMVKFTKPIYTQTPSIQGVWTPELDLYSLAPDEVNKKYFKLQIIQK
mmetsp:Transcript_56720/g.61448  ORF Transcript_56720/g.61448 Transcript_56720/m.61448 type:complete len:176 (+) Transcript_56720:53-580(+)